MKKGYGLILTGGASALLVGLFAAMSETKQHGDRAPHPAIFSLGAALTGAGIGTLGFGGVQRMPIVALSGAGMSIVGGLVMRHYYKRYEELQGLVITEDGALTDVETGAEVPLETLPAENLSGVPYNFRGAQIIAR